MESGNRAPRRAAWQRPNGSGGRQQRGGGDKDEEGAGNLAGGGKKLRRPLVCGRARHGYGVGVVWGRSTGGRGGHTGGADQWTGDGDGCGERAGGAAGAALPAHAAPASRELMNRPLTRGLAAAWMRRAV